MSQCAPQLPPRTDLQANLFDEVFLVLMSVLIFQMFVVPSMIRASQQSAPPLRPDAFLVASVVRRAPDDESPLAVGDDVRLYVRNQKSEFSFSGDLPGALKAIWPRTAGTNYWFRVTPAAGDTLHIGVWLAKLDAGRLGDATYRSAVAGDIDVVIYRVGDARNVQDALKSGTAPEKGLMVRLRADDGCFAEVPLPPDYLEASP